METTARWQGTEPRDAAAHQDNMKLSLCLKLFSLCSPMEEVFRSKGNDEKIIYNMQEVRQTLHISFSAALMWHFSPDLWYRSRKRHRLSIGKFNYYFALINSFKNLEDTALPEAPCKSSACPDLHRLGGRGWKAAQPGFWARGRGACRGGRACTAGGMQPSAPPGRPVENPKNQPKDRKCHFRKATLKIGPEREVCQLLRCIALARNQEWTIASLRKLIKYSIITSGLYTLSVVQQGTSTAHQCVARYKKLCKNPTSQGIHVQTLVV